MPQVSPCRTLARMAARPIPDKFRVAFSFAGEQRDLVRALAEAVEQALGTGTVFFDEWFEYWLAGADADLKLQDIYGQRSELVVVCVSERYGNKPWTLAEHEAIRARLQQARAASDPRERDAILPIRVGDGEVRGIQFTAIVPDARSKGIEATAQLILDRLRFLRSDLEAGAQTAAPGRTGPKSSGQADGPTTTPPQPGHTAPYSGRVKNAFCDRLANDWQKLSDELGIPLADQRQISANHPGTEGRGLWEWLDVRQQLARLAPACRAIGRADLADLLEAVPGAGAGPPGSPR